MTKKATQAAADLDTFFDDLAANGELIEIEVNENTEFTTVSFDSILDMMKSRILDRLPPAVREEGREQGTGRAVVHPTRFVAPSMPTNAGEHNSSAANFLHRPTLRGTS